MKLVRRILHFLWVYELVLLLQSDHDFLTKLLLQEKLIYCDIQS